MLSSRVNIYSFYATWVTVIVALYPVLRTTKYRVFFFLVVLALYVITLLSIGKKNWFRSIRAAPAVYLFFAVPFISAMWSIQPSETLTQASLLIAFGYIFLVSHVIFISKKVDWFYNSSLLLITFYSLVFITIYLFFGSVRAEGRYMKELTGSISNHIPAIALPLLPYLYVMWKQKRKRLLVGISFFLLIFIVVISESRAAYGLFLSYAVIIPLFMSSSVWIAARKLIPTVVLMGLAAGVAYYLVGQEVISSVLERFANSQLVQGDFSVDEQEGDFTRVVMILETLNIVSDDPLTGIGYYTFKDYMINKYGFGRMSHNIVLTVWGELGVLGLLTFTGVIVGAFRRASHAQAHALEQGAANQWMFLAATKAALVVLLLHAMVRPQLSNPMLYLVLAVCYGHGTRGVSIAYLSRPRTKMRLSNHG